MKIDHSFQLVRCSKDGLLYAYKIADHENHTEDYSLIKCLHVLNNDPIEVLEEKEVLIYKKDLLNVKSNTQIA